LEKISPQFALLRRPLDAGPVAHHEFPQKDKGSAFENSQDFLLVELTVEHPCSICALNRNERSGRFDDRKTREKQVPSVQFGMYCNEPLIMTRS
jgi:hypothetical protein